MPFMPRIGGGLFAASLPRVEVHQVPFYMTVQPNITTSLRDHDLGVSRCPFRMCIDHNFEPERPDRITAINDHMTNKGLAARCAVIPSRMATAQELSLVTFIA